ncbi:MAG: response regulator, partial [Elusimicrobiota bacterium]|nr:response regulator [Elusimicrobiota bacterium]
MGKALRILIVEDSDMDARLLLRTLRAGGIDPVYERVDTAEAMQAALDTKPWDIVLSDYSMPQFDALAALELAHRKDSDLPFIIISGTVGEDIAVAAMRAGASDYFMKGHLLRLIPVIERELREAAERRAHRQAEGLLQDIIENNPISIQIVDNEGFTLKTNPAHTALFGSAPPVDFSIFADLKRKIPGFAEILQRAKNGEAVSFPDIQYNVHDSLPEMPDRPVWVHVTIFQL